MTYTVKKNDEHEFEKVSAEVSAKLYIGYHRLAIFALSLPKEETT